MQAIGTEATSINQAAYLRPREAARYIPVSERTLRDWTARGIIPHYKVSHKVVLFRVSDLDRAMTRFRVNAVGEAV